MSDLLIETLGDQALLIRFGDRIDVQINNRVHAAMARILENRPIWLLDCVPAYASLAVFIDPGQFSDQQTPLHDAQSWLQALLSSEPENATTKSARLVEIPVCYGGEYGIDLDTLASHAGISPDEVIARHQAPIYSVAMLGFAPGFPYLLGLDPSLAMPRLRTPRTQVPAGSVGIGGAQTGIYPCEGPGGWRVIGRTPMALFAAQREPPALLSPGAQVRFVAVNAAAFARHGSKR